jgi:hypothetical protein
MSNFANFLKTLNIEVDVVSNSFVYYDPTNGKIEKIGNKYVKDDSLSILEVHHSTVTDIINGTKSPDDFIVEYDVALKQLALKEKTYEDNNSKIDTSMHRLPVVRTVSDEAGDRSSLIFNGIYDGVEVFVWISGTRFTKGMLVWYKNTVYKLLEDIELDEFDESKADAFVTDVVVSNIKSINHFVEYKVMFKSIFEGVHVDVWYRDLEHLPGQHVWIYNNVYRIREHQSADTSFNLENAELVLSNVLLYGDINKSLTFVSVLSPGDKILDNNRLYLCLDEKLNAKMQEKSIVFYTSKYQGLLYDEELKTLTKFSFTEKHNKLLADNEKIKDTIELLDNSTIEDGAKVLIGKNLYLATRLEVRDIDVNVVQNNLLGCWEIYLGKKTKRSLQKISYVGQDTLYFSVTSKYDPNILYRTMEFSLSKLLNDVSQIYPYQNDWERTREDVSVYTSKFFDTYSHEILE